MRGMMRVSGFSTQQTGQLNFSFNWVLQQLLYHNVYTSLLALPAEKKLYCIYVAIGQKRSTVAQIVKRLTDNGMYLYMW